MSFFDQCTLLQLTYLNFRYIIKPEEIRSQTFQVNDLLLYPISDNPHNCTCTHQENAEKKMSLKIGSTVLKILVGDDNYSTE
jgi:hypothetical protein